MRILALDGGGTGCRAVLGDGTGTVLATGTAGPANIASNPDLALENIVTLAQTLLQNAGEAADQVTQIYALLGVAGSNIHGATDRILSRLPFRTTKIVNDARIGLEGALGPSDGIVASIGTGSVVSMRRGSAIESMGGWGFTLGDQSSGAWLGRALLSESLLQYDGIVASTSLGRAVLAEFGGEPARMVAFATDAQPADFAAYARKIVTGLDDDDPLAIRLIAQGTDELCRLLRAACARFNDTTPPLIVLLGGLGSVYASRLPADLRAILQPPRGTPLEGALALAMQSFTTGSGHEALPDP